MKKTIFKGLIMGLACSFFTALNVNADYYETSEYTHDNIHYVFSQAQEDPLWLEMVQNADHTNLKSVVLPESYTIDNGTFFNELLGRRAVLHTIGYRAFYNSQLTDIKLPSTLKKIEKEAFVRTNIKSIELPEGLEYIGDRAFLGCDDLEEIKIPESIKYIGSGAFARCYILRKVEFPSTLRSLGGFTFRYTPWIDDIYCKATVPPAAEDHDFGVIYYNYWPQEETMDGPRYCTLHVPAESVELYKKAPGWKMFSKIVPMSEVNVGVNTTGEEEKAISYQAENGMLTVDCNAGDVVAIYDANGICLLQENCTEARKVSLRGNGIRIIKLNGASAKVVL